MITALTIALAVVVTVAYAAAMIRSPNDWPL